MELTAVGDDAQRATRPRRAHGQALKRRIKREPIRFGLVVLYLLGIYTYIKLHLAPGLLIPGFIAGIAGSLLLLQNLKRVRTRHLLAIGGMVLVATLSIALRTDHSLAAEHFKGLIHFAYSLVLAYSLFLELSRWDRDEVATLFYYPCVLILVGCALEHTTPLRAISDAFRVAVFKTDIVYSSVARDISIFGVERPKLFTSEPSYVAVFLLLSMTVWLALSTDRFKLVKYGLMGIAGFLLIGSPIVLLTIFTAGVVILYLEIGGVKRLLLRMSVRKLVLLLGVFLLSGGLVAAAIQTGFSRRVALTAAGGEGSFTLRIIAPVIVAYDALERNPLWGIGMTGKETMESQLRQRFAQLKVDVSRIADQIASKMFNAFWLHWTYLGLLGGSLMILMIGRLMTALGARHYLYCLLTILIFTQTLGGYVGSRTWTFFFLIFLTSAILRRHERQAQFAQTHPDLARSPAYAAR